MVRESRREKSLKFIVRTEKCRLFCEASFTRDSVGLSALCHLAIMHVGLVLLVTASPRSVLLLMCLLRCLRGRGCLKLWETQSLSTTIQDNLLHSDKESNAHT